MTTDTSIRPGEVAVDPPHTNDAGLVFIGRIRTPFASRADCPRQGDLDGPECTIELFVPWDQGLAGIERNQRLQVLYWLDHSRRDLVLQMPRGRTQPTGVFGLRSPVRPNPIGSSEVRLVARDGNRLIVQGLDCVDGTPLIDLKPVRCPAAEAGGP
jgi:tRNA-Thr(GGU) m(6)t(6)A37 methyltransferase TsaA